MKSKNPVNFQGIIHRKENCKKQKQNKNQAMCDRSSKKLFIHTTNKNKKTKQNKTNKQNKTHLQQYYILKTYRETAVLIGNCVDFLSVYFRKIQPGFL
jgi:hypothetical protein